MKAPGELAWIYYDPAPEQEVAEDDYLRTTTGRTYRVFRIRVQQSGKHTGRLHCLTIVMPPDHVLDPDTRVHELNWYPR